MFGVKVCPQCGVPKRLVKENRWLSDATIVQSKNTDHRMIFIECELACGGDLIVDVFPRR